ncbi:hypothetical protein B0H17DRAFT_986807, partial [Mycena rosella]
MAGSSNPITPELDVRPLSPVSDKVDAESTSAPSIAENESLDPPQERKLTIRVPVEYVPPTPPPSASLPAIPPPGQRQSVTPVSTVQRKRASAPVQSWSGANTFIADDKPPPKAIPAPSMAPVMSTVQETTTPPGPVNVTVTEAQSAPPKMILVATSNSARHLPSVTAKKAQAVAQEKQGTSERQGTSAPRYGPELLPTPASELSQPRRVSGPGPQQQQARRTRTSPSIHNSPSYVSLIDFETSEEEEEDDQHSQSQSQSDAHPPSIPEESETPTPRAQRQGPSAASDDAELSRWAPEPAYFPNQSIS